MPSFFPILASFATALLGMIYPFTLPLILLLSSLGLGFLLWQRQKKGFKPQSQDYKTLEKIKKKRQKTEENKHKHINDQIAYIAQYWGYSKEQEKTIEQFIQTRSYSQIYNKLTASFLPQMINLIDNCNERGQKGCKRAVAKRLRELTDLMKKELQKKKTLSNESFDVGLEVYDELMKA